MFKEEYMLLQQLLQLHFISAVHATVTVTSELKRGQRNVRKLRKSHQKCKLSQGKSVAGLTISLLGEVEILGQ